MREQTIGIVGGAGPMAGLLLAQKVFRLCQTEYGCCRDADFPRLLLLSEPFVEMLSAETVAQNSSSITHQLENALDLLIDAGAQRIAIACNTLHAFVDTKRFAQLISVIQVTEEALVEQGYGRVLVLASGTSAASQLYRFPGALWPRDQGRVDRLIDRVLAGEAAPPILEELTLLLAKEQEVDVVLLGCSELSVLAQSWDPPCPVIDPMDLLAKKLLLTPGSASTHSELFHSDKSSSLALLRRKIGEPHCRCDTIVETGSMSEAGPSVVAPC